MPITEQGFVFTGLKFPTTGEGAFEPKTLQHMVEDAHWQILVANEKLTELEAALSEARTLATTNSRLGLPIPLDPANYVLEFPCRSSQTNSRVVRDIMSEEHAAGLLSTVLAVRRWFRIGSIYHIPAEDITSTEVIYLIMTEQDTQILRRLQAIVREIKELLESPEPQGYLAADLPYLEIRSGPREKFHFGVWDNTEGFFRTRDPKDEGTWAKGVSLPGLFWESTKDHCDSVWYID